MSINGTLAFVILWIVNALIALVYLLVGICYFQQGTCADTSESGRGAGAQHGAAGRIACRQ